VYDRSSRDVSEKWHLTAAGVSLVALNNGRPIGRDGRSLSPGDRLRWQPSHQLKPTLNYFDISSPRTVSTSFASTLSRKLKSVSLILIETPGRTKSRQGVCRICFAMRGN
jgi:hypothetical protein